MITLQSCNPADLSLWAVILYLAIVLIGVVVGYIFGWNEAKRKWNDRHGD